MRLQHFFITLCIALFFASCGQDDTIIGGGENPGTGNGNTTACNSTVPFYPTLSGNQLIDSLKNCFTPSTSFSYTEARTHLYRSIDVINGKVQCIYSGYETEVSPSSGQSYINAAAVAGINCEHSFPQSMGAGNEPAKSDMFHLYPALAYVNEARSNKYYDDINDSQTDKWYYLQQVQTSIPSGNRDLWSESNELAWEPRESIKGDVARSIFYFKLIYSSANQQYFNQMKETLLTWHQQDPVDQKERNRNNKIKLLQGNDNPFILDEDLAERVFGN